MALETEPDADIGSVCKNPYQCEFKSHCWKDIAPDSIHKLTRISAKKRIELTELSIERIRDIPPTFKLTANQAVQRKCEIEQSPHIEFNLIKESLAQLKWPLYFLDYETISHAIPQYDGTSPYQHLPFQFSLHIQREKGAPLVHKEFLHLENSNPRRSLAASLCAEIANDGGAVIAYHASFEREKTNALAEAYPEFQGHLKSITVSGS